MNTVIGTRSPQVAPLSLRATRTHHVSERAPGMSFALRLPARISALVADRFAWRSPSATARRFDACPSDPISRWTRCPPRISRCEAARLCVARHVNTPKLNLDRLDGARGPARRCPGSILPPEALSCLRSPSGGRLARVTVPVGPAATASSGNSRARFPGKFRIPRFLPIVDSYARPLV